MPIKEVKTPYPLIDADPHFSRVVGYFRPSDYLVWAGTTAAVPATLWLWGMFLKTQFLHSRLTLSIEKGDPVYTPHIKNALRTPMRLGGLLGCIGGFLLAYQNSSGASFRINHRFSSDSNHTVRFWGWAENEREAERDLKELTQRAKEGKPLYGTSTQPAWVQHAASANSTFSQLKFCTFLPSM